MREADHSTYGRAVRFSFTLRRALLGAALSLGLALPGAALGHEQTLSASTMSIESAAKVCRKDTPRAEKRRGTPPSTPPSARRAAVRPAPPVAA